MRKIHIILTFFSIIIICLISTASAAESSSEHTPHPPLPDDPEYSVGFEKQNETVEPGMHTLEFPGWVTLTLPYLSTADVFIEASGIWNCMVVPPQITFTETANESILVSIHVPSTANDMTTTFQVTFTIKVSVAGSVSTITVGETLTIDVLPEPEGEKEPEPEVEGDLIPIPGYISLFAVPTAAALYRRKRRI